MEFLFQNDMIILFSILALGYFIGRFKFKGISVGSVGVLFAGMLFGHFGMSLPGEIMDLGLLLFLYSVGLEAGPSFFRLFKKSFSKVILIAIVAAVAPCIAAAVLVYFNLPFNFAAGLFIGGLINTPALAAVMEITEHLSKGSGKDLFVAYSIAYPYALISVPLVNQFLPKILKKDVKKEAEEWLEEQKSETPDLLAKQYKITNPNCVGKTIRSLKLHSISNSNITRLRHKDRVKPFSPELVLSHGDVVVAVGTEKELNKLGLLLGEETYVKMDINRNILSVDMEIFEDRFGGKKLSELQIRKRYGVFITRIKRQGIEITPGPGVTLELGDIIHIIGEKPFVENFEKVAGSRAKADITSIMPFLLGIFAGLLAGLIPWTFPGGFTFKLGDAGGVFLISILIGHFGSVGPFRLYVPGGAKKFAKELGIILFLGAAGTCAGADFVSILREWGVMLLFSGVIITTTAIVSIVLFMNFILKINILASMGYLSASMTNSAGLDTAMSHTDSDLPALSYASVYPAALIFKIIAAQILIYILFRIH